MNDSDNAEDRKQDLEEIQELGSVTTGSINSSIHCIVIVGQVEGHQVLPPQNKTTKYEHIMPQIAAIEESPDIKGLLILLNTVGGDIEAGLAIAELIAGMSKPTVSLVLGGGHSIGVPLAVAAKKILCGAVRRHDDSSGSSQRHDHRRPADVHLLRENSGPHRQIRDAKLWGLRTEVSGYDAENGRTCGRCRLGHRWGRGGRDRFDRSARRPFGRAGCAASDDR